MTITPIGERVLIKPAHAEEKTKSGIYIPENAQEKKKEGTVISAGTYEDGKSLPLKAGDHVIYGGYSSDKITVDSEEYVVVPFKDVLAKIE